MSKTFCFVGWNVCSFGMMVLHDLGFEWFVFLGAKLINTYDGSNKTMTFD